MVPTLSPPPPPRLLQPRFVTCTLSTRSRTTPLRSLESLAPPACGIQDALLRLAVGKYWRCMCSLTVRDGLCAGSSTTTTCCSTRWSATSSCRPATRPAPARAAAPSMGACRKRPRQCCPSCTAPASRVCSGSRLVVCTGGKPCGAEHNRRTHYTQYSKDYRHFGLLSGGSPCKH